MKKLIVIFVALATINTYAQVTVANLSQVPSALHPSMVGSTGNKRLTAAYGVGNSSRWIDYGFNGRFFYNYKNLLQNNFTLSYDQMLKKLGSGIGGYLNYGYVPTQSGVIYNYLDPYTVTRSRMFSAGVSFAPKYNIMKKKKPDEVRFTWSPSIAFTFYNDKYTSSTDIPMNNSASLFPRNDFEYYRRNVFSAELGGLINSKRLLLGATLGYKTDHKAFLNSASAINDSNMIRVNSSKISTSLMFGISFPKKENSFLGYSFTEKLIMYGFKNNLFVGTYANHNLRIWKVLVGVAGSSYYGNRNISIYLGYKAKNWKVTVGGAKYNHEWSFGETTFVYTFK
jgi:hypothetical protein